MKKRVFSYVAAGALLLSGCVVTSVCPFYTQQDTVNEPRIAGHWVNTRNPGEKWRFEQNLDKSYRLMMTEGGKVTILAAQPFMLGGELFLDLGSLDQDIHVIPAHYLVRVTQLAPALKMSELNHEWLKGLVERDPKAVHHHLVAIGDQPEGRVVLTGDTAELQEFVYKHLRDAAAWKATFELVREPRTNLLAKAASGL
jgi:hypothetical protein